MTNKEVNWVNYGDVNPLEHGGIWVRKDADIEGAYYIVKNVYRPVAELYEVYDLWVETGEEWQEKNLVMDYIGMTEDTFNEIHYAIALTDYYNFLNFGEVLSFKGIIELGDYLIGIGIEIEHNRV